MGTSRKRKLIDNGDGTFSVPLTKGAVAIVDAADADEIGRHSWTLQPIGRGYGCYAERKSKRRKFYMHRQIMRAAPDQQVDHINLNGLDNRRSNLRVCTSQENTANTRARSSSKTGIKGVSRSGRLWVARITVDGRTIRIGSFATAEAASAAYAEAAKKEWGEFARSGEAASLESRRAG